MPQTAAASRYFDHPPWVFLDTPTRIERCEENSTTATCKTSAGHDIVVSFSVARPPALSRCFVHCPGLTAAEAFRWPPHVTGADGALLLINASFVETEGAHNGLPFIDIFVYRAGPGEPSLYLVLRPYPSIYIYTDNVGVISCGGGEHHLVVVPEHLFEAFGRMDYDLHVFSSETMSWSTTVAVDGDTDCKMLVLHEPTKVISIGGAWLAWIDLRYGVLLCNVVDNHLPEIRLVQLPSLMPANKADFEEGFDGAVPPLRQVRDVTCRNDGLIRFIEIEYYPELEEDKWEATMFTRGICSESGWEWCCTVDSADLSPTDTCLPGLFPEIWDGKKLTLDKVISSSPTLDMYDDDVFYMMAKLSFDDSNGWVLAVNARNRTLESVAPFASETYDFNPTYQQCAFSKHLISKTLAISS